MLTLNLTTTIEAKKNSYKVGRGRLYRDAGAVESEKSIIRELWAESRRQGANKPLRGPVRVAIAFARTGHDLINKAETVLDALQGGHKNHGLGLIIENDSQVEHLTLSVMDPSEAAKGLTAIVSVSPL